MNSVKKYLSSVDISSIASLISAVDHVSALNVSFDKSASISFLRNFTIEGIEPYIKYHLYMSDIKPNIVFGNYNTVHQEVLDGNSHLYSSPADVIVLSLMLEQLDAECRAPNWSAGKTKEQILQLFDLVASKSSALIIVNTFIPPFYSNLGIASSSLLSGGEEITELNESIRDYVKGHSGQFFLADWERFIRITGEGKGIDYRYWYMSKAPFKKDFLNLYALEIVKIVKALKGYVKKCLVLDCDNVLWGGIIGEDELNGINLDKNDYPGRAYYDFQMSVLHLVERGVSVVLCSKNNEEDVWNVLDHHPCSLIKRSHLSGWRINWDNKVDNLISLANELNLGIDSFVFIDDDPSEYELVKRYLPEITVLQVPTNLYTYPQLLFREGLFDALNISTEDKQRSVMYQAEAQRRQEKSRFENLEEYLASTELSAVIHLARDHEIGRVAQLTQKTNQFNLTTRRYSERDIRDFCSDPAWAVYSLTAKDKFGDYGLTGVLIARHEGEEGIIDTLLLSCRILGRRFEISLVEHCFRDLEDKWNIKRWKAEYIPTKKNQQVANFWNSVGSKQVEEINGTRSYFMERGGLKSENTDFIKVIGD